MGMGMGMKRGRAKVLPRTGSMMLDDRRIAKVNSVQQGGEALKSRG